MVPVEARLGVDEGDVQVKSRDTLHQAPTKEMEKGVVVVLDKTFEEGRVEAAASEECRDTGHSQHQVEMEKGFGGVGTVEDNMRKDSRNLGQFNNGLSGPDNNNINKEVDELLLKGSCSVWAQSNKFGPLLEIQQEGGVVLRDSDSEVARLGFLEAQHYGPAEDGPCNGSKYKGRRKGGLHSKKKKNNKQGAPKCCSDPIQTPSVVAARDETMCAPEVSDMNSFNNESLVDGIPRCMNQVDPVNFRIEAERLFNIGMNLGILLHNEDRILMVERLVDSNGAEDLVGDVEVDR
ncbi:hypothetical protein P8452_25725 [Trifolium repens]|nr:hypothetical protein P8452_25725 [Trifolium repens]